MENEKIGKKYFFMNYHKLSMILGKINHYFQ